MTFSPLLSCVVRIRYHLALTAIIFLIACGDSDGASYTPSDPIGVTYEPSFEWQRPEGGTTSEPEEGSESLEPTEAVNSGPLAENP